MWATEESVRGEESVSPNEESVCLEKSEDSSLVIFSVHSLYAKSGPPLMVAGYFEIASSQRAGRCRNAAAT